MDRLRHVVVLAKLIDALRDKGSWCGETHIQKSVYFLQELAQADTDFDFILYKHGPFSFDLRDRLSEMRALGLLKLEFQTPGYGPSVLLVEDRVAAICSRFPKTVHQYHDRIAFMAERLGTKKVKELERLATALYVSNDLTPGADVSTAAAKICKLKPHISPSEAEEAVHTVEIWRQEATDQIGSSN